MRIQLKERIKRSIVWKISNSRQRVPGEKSVRGLQLKFQEFHHVLSGV